MTDGVVMRTMVGRARSRRRRARGLAIVAAAITALGVGAAIASPPRSARLEELDGRTWFATADGTQLLLVNGISGLIEAATAVPGAPGPVTFVDGRGPSTLLRGQRGLLVVDDGEHDVALVDGAAGAAFVGDDVLLLGDDVRRAPRDDAGRSAPVRGAPAPLPVPGAGPFTDGAGDGWYLGVGPAGRVAVRVPQDGSGPRLTPVADDVARLLRADGHLYAASPSDLVPLGDAPGMIDGDLGVDDADRVDPTVATATGGTWAWAVGSTVHGRSAVGEDAVAQDLGSPIERLAVWHGRLVAVTRDGVHTGEPGALVPVPDLGAGATLHEDGGLLWAATSEAAVAIDPDHQQTVIRLAGADLSLCVGDCSPAAASSFLEETTPTTAPSPPAPNAPTTTTTAPARRLTADVPPTLGPASTTVVPPTTSTTPATTTTAPTVTATESTGSTLAPVTTTTTVAAAGPPAAQDPNRPPDPGPPARLPELATTTTTEAEPEPTTTETEPADEAVGLGFNVVGRTGTAEATLRVFGSAEDCGATSGTTTALLTWDGSDRGSREVLVAWRGGASRSEETSATIVADAGELDVTVTVCGVTASDSATVRALPTATTTTTTTTTTPSTTTTTEPPTTTTPPTTPTTPPTTPTSSTTTTTTTTATRPTTTSTTTRPEAAAGGAP